MKTARLLALVAALTMTAPLVWLAPTTSYAADQSCDGKPTTIDVPDVSGRVDGTPGDDVILVDPHPDGGDTGVPWSGHEPLGIFGGGGDDTICLLVAADVFGGAGSDTIRSDEASQQAPNLYPQLNGGAGDDVLIGGALAPGMWGGPGDDTLSDPGVANVFEGPGAVGHDTISVGDDSTLDLTALGHGVTVDLATGQTKGMGGTTISGGVIRNVVGTPYTDTLIGTHKADHINGSKGDADSIVGGAGDDHLRGGRNSQAHGGHGNDILVLRGKHSIAWGGPGDDVCRAAVRHGCESQ